MFTADDESNFLWFAGLLPDFVNYHLIGFLSALAIYNDVLVDLPFPLALYKKILSQPITLEDFTELVCFCVQSERVLTANLRFFSIHQKAVRSSVYLNTKKTILRTCFASHTRLQSTSERTPKVAVVLTRRKRRLRLVDSARYAKFRSLTTARIRQLHKQTKLNLLRHVDAAHINMPLDESHHFFRSTFCLKWSEARIITSSNKSTPS